MNFDQVIDRTGTHAFKWEKYKGKDILPMWVADTEFKCAQPILDALHARTEHGLMGYHLPAQYQPANDAVARWLDKQHDWQIKPEWIVWTPGVVPAFNVACKAYCETGDKVIIQTPNYPPLLAAPALNDLERLDLPTVKVDERWMMDFDVLEEHAKDPKCKLFVLCNPMNPVGSVLTQEELDRVKAICQQNDVTLCSDEIHCDLILDEAATHIPAGKLDTSSITLMAASKTFNVAGLGASFAIIPDAKVRLKFTKAAAGIVPWVTVLGLVATEAAFTLCDDWYDAQLKYLRENRDFLCDGLNQIEGFDVIPPQATYLAWVDGSQLQVPSPQKYVESKGVGPSPGTDFGSPQFVRFNFGCPRTYLEQCIERLKS